MYTLYTLNCPAKKKKSKNIILTLIQTCTFL
jgi:hypothetical protein